MVDRLGLIVLWNVLAITSMLVLFGVVVAGSATTNVICNRIPDLTPKQRAICNSRPDAMAAVGDGDRLALLECRVQMRFNRWNCTNIGGNSSTLGTSLVKTKEMSFYYAIRSAAIVYMVTQLCGRGSLEGCGCDRTKQEGKPTPDGWRWGGCSADVQHGVRFTRAFVDAKEMEEDSRALMNLHNNKAGRKAVKDTMREACRCNGVSGSCAMKTCWMTMANFRQIGDRLHQKYRQRPQLVAPLNDERTTRPRFLVLDGSRKKPSGRDLVYIDKSPSYCDYDPATGSLGTVGRQCNRTSTLAENSCDQMCCGRGYATREYTRVWQCNCTFQWCCHVSCSRCSQLEEMHTCK